MKKTFAIALLIAALAAGCGSRTSTDPTSAAPATTSSTATPTKVTERRSTTTTERPTTTTTAEPVDDAALGRLALTMTMCSEIGYDSAFDVDWCDIDSDSSTVIQLVGTACSVIDEADPYGTASDEEISETIATQMVDMILTDPTMDAEQATTMVSFIGGVTAIREEMC